MTFSRSSALLPASLFCLAVLLPGEIAAGQATAPRQPTSARPAPGPAAAQARS